MRNCDEVDEGCAKDVEPKSSKSVFVTAFYFALLWGIGFTVVHMIWDHGWQVDGEWVVEFIGTLVYSLIFFFVLGSLWEIYVRRRQR
jgi:hypothetical protein